MLLEQRVNGIIGQKTKARISNHIQDLLDHYHSNNLDGRTKLATKQSATRKNKKYLIEREGDLVFEKYSRKSEQYYDRKNFEEDSKRNPFRNNIVKLKLLNGLKDNEFVLYTSKSHEKAGLLLRKDVKNTQIGSFSFQSIRKVMVN